MSNLMDYFEEFVKELRIQLEEDDKRWGDSWKNRTAEGQVYRIKQRFQDYWDQYENGNEDIPWLKIAGNAYIAWLRENFPENCPDPEFFENRMVSDKISENCTD